MGYITITLAVKSSIDNTTITFEATRDFKSVKSHSNIRFVPVDGCDWAVEYNTDKYQYVFEHTDNDGYGNSINVVSKYDKINDCLSDSFLFKIM